MVAVAVNLLPYFEKQAKKKQIESGKNYGRGQDEKVTQKIGESNKHTNEATQQAAEKLGTNRQYVSEAKRIKEASPEKLAKLILLAIIVVLE